MYMVRQRRRQKRSIDELVVEQRCFLASRGDTGAGKDTSSPSTVVSCARPGTEQAVPTISAASSHHACRVTSLCLWTPPQHAQKVAKTKPSIHPLTKTSTPQRRTGTRLTKTSKIGGDRGPRGLLNKERSIFLRPKAYPTLRLLAALVSSFSAHM